MVSGIKLSEPAGDLAVAAAICSRFILVPLFCLFSYCYCCCLFIFTPYFKSEKQNFVFGDESKDSLPKIDEFD